MHVELGGRTRESVAAVSRHPPRKQRNNCKRGMSGGEGGESDIRGRKRRHAPVDERRARTKRRGTGVFTSVRDRSSRVPRSLSAAVALFPPMQLRGIVCSVTCYGLRTCLSRYIAGERGREPADRGSLGCDAFVYASSIS